MSRLQQPETAQYDPLTANDCPAVESTVLDSTTVLQVSSTSPAPSTSGRWFGGFWRRQDPALKAEQDYAVALSGCCDEDFSDLDALGFLQVEGPRDRMGRPVVVVVARNFPAKVIPKERLYRYLITRCDPVVSSGSYSLVWVHTQSTYLHNCPSIAWLWATYERLPARYRTNLQHVYMLHCNLTLWAATASLLPWFSTLLWRKVCWISRVEFLWDYVAKNSVQIPAFVAEHDSILEDQPLQDYGLVASKEMTQGVGMPAPM